MFRLYSFINYKSSKIVYIYRARQSYLIMFFNFIRLPYLSHNFIFDDNNSDTTRCFFSNAIHIRTLTNYEAKIKILSVTINLSG